MKICPGRDRVGSLQFYGSKHIRASPTTFIDAPNRIGHSFRMSEPTTVFRARVPARRLQHAEKVLCKLGLKSPDAVHILLAQTEIQQGLPFEIGAQPKPLLSSEVQAEAWTEAFGAY